jgi:hypothetical protein
VHALCGPLLAFVAPFWIRYAQAHAQTFERTLLPFGLLALLAARGVRSPALRTGLLVAHNASAANRLTRPLIHRTQVRFCVRL